MRLVRFRDDSVSSLPPGPLLLRLSDPVMLRAVRTLTRAARSFLGPGPAVMERCDDKYEAHRVAIANGVDSPPTALASEASTMHETGTGRIRFLECDVAPLVGASSAFAASLEAAGMGRAEQLRMLLDEDCR